MLDKRHRTCPSARSSKYFKQSLASLTFTSRCNVLLLVGLSESESRQFRLACGMERRSAADLARGGEHKQGDLRSCQ